MQLKKQMTAILLICLIAGIAEATILTIGDETDTNGYIELNNVQIGNTTTIITGGNGTANLTNVAFLNNSQLFTGMNTFNNYFWLQTDQADVNVSFDPIAHSLSLGGTGDNQGMDFFLNSQYTGYNLIWARDTATLTVPSIYVSGFSILTDGSLGGDWNAGSLGKITIGEIDLTTLKTYSSDPAVVGRTTVLKRNGGTGYQPIVFQGLNDSDITLGKNTQVIFNDNNITTGSYNFTFNKTTATLNVTHIIGDGSGLTGISGGNSSFNQSLTDSLYEVKEQFVKLNSDVTTDNATAYNTTVLSLNVDANKNYTFTCELLQSSNLSTVGIQFNLTFPDSPTYIIASFIVPISTSAVGLCGCANTPDTCVCNQLNSPIVPVPGRIVGRLVNGANSGAITLRVKSELSTGKATIYRESFCYSEVQP